LPRYNSTGAGAGAGAGIRKDRQTVIVSKSQTVSVVFQNSK